MRDNMKKNSFSPILYSLGTAMLLPLLLSSCSVLPGETRYDDSTIKYSVGADEKKTSKYNTGQKSVTSTSRPKVTAKYSQNGDPNSKSYNSSPDGVKSTVGQYENATAHYTLKQRGANFPKSDVIRVQQAPQQPVAETVEVVEKRVMVLEISDVLFDFDKAVIKAAYVPELDKWVDYFKANPEASASIHGFADSTGPEAYNLTLSEKRAMAVVKYLVDHGVPQERLTAKGFGESQPAADNSTKEGRQKNRRVEMAY